MFALSNSFKFFGVFFNECTRGRLTSLTPPLFIEVLVPRQESERSCICVLVISIFPLCTILIFYFGIVVTACFLFHFIYTFFRFYSWGQIKDPHSQNSPKSNRKIVKKKEMKTTHFRCYNFAIYSAMMHNSHLS